MKALLTRLAMSHSKARLLALALMILAITLGIGRTLFDPDLTGAIIGLSSAPVFYWLYKNPGVMLARDFEEFCQQFDKARDMKFLFGFPLYYLLLAAAILYIVAGRSQA